VLDEQRPKFLPIIVLLPPIDSKELKDKPKLRRCWLRGVQSGISGSRSDVQGLVFSDLRLPWVIGKCTSSSEFDEYTVDSLLEKSSSPTYPVCRPRCLFAIPSLGPSGESCACLDLLKPVCDGSKWVDIQRRCSSNGSSIGARLLKAHDSGRRDS